MRLRVTLVRADGPIDLEVTADATATVSDVAGFLARADPGNAGLEVPDDLSLQVRASGAPRVLSGATTIADAGVRSGSAIELVRTAGDYAPGVDRGAAAAVVRVLAGPDAGREFPVPVGAWVVGRDRDVDIRLSDPMVSRRHARINVAETVEVVDLNSANGMLIGDGRMVRAAVTSTDVVMLGDTSLCVVPLQSRLAVQPSAEVEHVRSPRVIPRHPGDVHPAPAPPKAAPRQRFPFLALMAPLIAGAVMFAMTQQLMSVVMMALTPVLLVASFVDQSMTVRRETAARRREFEESLASTRERLARIQDEERSVRRAESPSTSDLADAASRLGPLLWSARPEHPGFLEVNLGIGRLPSRNKIELPTAQDTLPEHWESLLRLREDFSGIDGVPVTVGLRSCGALGLAGSPEPLGAAARSVVFQLAARHSPAELALAAVVTPRNRAGWEWLKWLPHAHSAHSPIGGPHLVDGPAAAASLLSQLEGVIAARLEGEPALRGPLDPEKSVEMPEPVVPALVLLVDNEAPIDRGRLTRLAERGADAGVHVVWCAPAVSQLPAACRSYLAVGDGGGEGLTGMVRLGELTAPVSTEVLAVERAEGLARGLAPVIDVGTPDEDDSDLPRSLSYISLAGRGTVDDPASVVERWRQNNSLTPRDGSPPVRRKREGHLRALVGHAGSEPFVLDLRSDGPHALVGGTTGAGKSEFLQTWVLGMAAAHSPDRLTFLFVDYKGGAAFADCVHLPHTVGLVTDLSPHLVRRALTSLRAELRFREHLLQRKKAKDLVSLERTGDPECPPSLVIVVDEFAALVQEVPEFVDGVVDVAQRGRSLGLHLVLATQRPAGVIKDNLRANTNLRIALRMADTDDSVDILGDQLAAYFDPSIPGRGAAKTGPGRLRTFQTGYVGGHTSDVPPRPRIDVQQLGFGPGVVWEKPVEAEAAPQDPGPTDIARIVHAVATAAGQAEVPTPRKPWLPELASVYSLELLPNPRTDEQIPLGVLDEPENQAQPTVYYQPDRDGNVAIFGTGGSGKTTTLRTLAVGAALTTHRGGPTHVYALDFAAGGLRMLEDLPHVGAVVPGDDDERVVRTIRMLRDLVDDRAVRYATIGAGSVGDYRRLAGAPHEARVLLLVDGIGAFREQYEFGSAQAAATFTAFAQVAADGRQLGVHIVMTADRPSALPPSIASTVQRRFVLRLAGEDDYMMLGEPKDVLSPASPPGRAMLAGNEVQFAILGRSPNVAAQAREIQKLAGSMRRRMDEGSAPAPVRRLPDLVDLAALPVAIGGAATIGVEDLGLGPAGLAITGPLLLAGPPGSGRTTALATIAAAVGRAEPGVRRILLTPRRSALARLDWATVATGVAEVAAVARRLADEIEANPDGARSALFLESVTDFTGGEAEPELDRLIRAAVRAESLVIGEAETSTWTQAWTLSQPFKSGRRGLLLVPGEMDGDTLLGTPLGRLRRADFPAGRGFLIERGRAAKVQVAQSNG